MWKFVVTLPAASRLCLAVLFTFFSVGGALAEDSSVMARHAERSLLLDSVDAGQSIIAVGERGHVLKSSDQGRSWRQIVVPTRVLLTAVDFIDAKHGFIVGHDAVILRTEDGGSSWQIVHQAPEQDRPLLDVLMHNRQRVTAIGAYGLYLESDDNGITWNERPLIATDWGGTAGDEQADDDFVEDFHLNQIAVAASGHWYIAAEAGTVYRSDDQGGQWMRLPSPYDGSFFGVLPLAREQVLVVGMQGQMFFSDDAGEHWQPIVTGTNATLTHALMLRDGGMVVTGHGGSILLADRNPSRFNLIRLPQRMAIAAATELAGGDLLLVGEGALRWSPRELSLGDRQAMR